MRNALRSAAATAQRWWRLLILFLVLRLLSGIVLLAFDDGFAWSIELTLIIAASLAVYLLVAFAVRLWAPPRRAN
jgi:hypothetical protein